MQVFHTFKVRAPPTECEISGTDDKMRIRLRSDTQEFRVKAATDDRNWFYIVRPPDTLSA
jgi:hypothetical protein